MMGNNLRHKATENVTMLGKVDGLQTTIPDNLVKGYIDMLCGLQREWVLVKSVLASSLYVQMYTGQ